MKLNMVLSKGEAFDLLELPVGADRDSIRTNYKRLALKWHPEKHGNSTDAVKRFRQVSKAYKRLQTDSDSDMALDEMLRMFQEVFFSKSLGTLNGSGYDTSDDDDDDTDDSEDDIPYPLYTEKIKLKQDLKKKGRENARHLTPEEVNKNAEELITEEEKEKRKAEKRKAKKKRRRERKKLEKQDQKDDKPRKDKSEKGKKDRKGHHTGSSSEGEDAGFDPNSAFFTKVVNKKKKGQTTPDTTQSSKKDKTKDKQQSGAKSEEEVEDLDPIVLRSRQLAIRGNEMAQLGHYNPAIELFTEAINLDPRDFRFFGNRSYCFDRIHQYDKALRDAEKAIVLAKDWAKGYFRKGRALAGLKMFPEAEKAFMQVLKLDKNCDDAVQELLRVRTYQLTEMGFSRQQAEAAIKKHGSVQTALDSLLAGVDLLPAENSLSGEVYFSDEDEFITPTPRSQSFQQPSDIKMDHNNPEGLTALWVGNVLPQVTEKKLVQMFQKYGTVTSVRLLPEKYCAFVNFKLPVSAGKAMQTLQGVECEGQRLLIKFPDNPICNGNGPAQTILKKNTSSQSKAQQQQQQQQQQLLQQQQQQQQAGVRNQPKQSGPVNGDECYFWRTTGCIYGDKCHWKHLPDHKGVDKKPWQKNAA